MRGGRLREVVAKGSSTVDFFGTTHGAKPVSENGISLRSPSLIMAPGET